MYILTSKFKKDNKYIFKARMCVVCREILASKYIFIVFFKNKSDDYLFLYIRNLAFKNGFPVNNIHLYLCGQVDNTKWILCSRKIGVKSLNVRI